MNIGLLMGSFDPIHIGHLHMASLVLNANLCDQIWFVIAKHNPWKEAPSASFQDRRLMAVAAINNSGFNCRVCTIEKDLEDDDAYAYRTLNLLSTAYPNHTFTIIGGTDVMASITQWKNYKDAIQGKYRLIEIKRGDDTKQSVKITHVHNLDLGDYVSISTPQLDVSSTYIREMIKEGKNPVPLIHDKVREHIIYHQLYI